MVQRHAWLKTSTLAWALAAVAAMVGGCDTPETATSLHPEGPPMLQQVVMKELAPDATGTLRSGLILAFGSHELVADTKEHATTNAAANDQTIRVVLDELLVGNALEEIACRTRQISDTEACVVPGGFSRVPEGTTPDDIADCASANDLLDERCSGSHATCLEGGIPCGVLDEDENGSVDNTRMIAGQVRIMCGGVEVPLNLEQSFWQPAGNQQVPAGLTAESSLGPALILRPLDDGRMPTNSDCVLVFAADVTDKHGNQICAPPGGDITANCTPGDLSAFTFKTEIMRMTSSSPDNAQTGVPRTPATIGSFWNAPIAPATLAGGFTVMEGTVARTDFTASLSTAGNALTLTSVNQFAASTLITVTFTSLTDTFGKPLSAPVSFSFTTAN